MIAEPLSMVQVVDGPDGGHAVKQVQLTNIRIEPVQPRHRTRSAVDGGDVCEVILCNLDEVREDGVEQLGTRITS